MRGQINITTTATNVIPPEVEWSVCILQNVSDTDMYYQFTQESDAVTTTNGLKLAAGSEVQLIPPNTPRRGGVYAIHGGTGSKVLRYAAQ